MALEMKYFRSQDEAGAVMLDRNKEYTPIRHLLGSGDRLSLHSHLVDQVMIFPEKGEIRLDFEHQAYLPDFKPGPVGAIKIPAGIKHGIKVNSTVVYWVYREKLPRSPVKLLNCWLNTVFNRSIGKN